jgi:TPR repeat protein
MSARLAARVALASTAASLLTAATASQCDDSLIPNKAASKVEFLSELNRLKATEKETRLRWIRDEENWRKLPARAWPPQQPDEDALKTLQAAAVSQCKDKREAPCHEAEFLLATCLCFNNIDFERGFSLYKKAADEGHADSATAVGVCIVEDYCRLLPEAEAVQYLLKSAAQGNTQAIYELAVLNYTGNVECVPENEKAAAEGFMKAAKLQHTGAQFMVADMITSHEGDLPHNYAEALRLFYEAAEKGHRFSRQQFLAIMDGKHELNKKAA